MTGRGETFNPLFPNGCYFTRSPASKQCNTLKQATNLALSGALRFQWRETTGDALYLQGSQIVLGTAGKGSLWTGHLCAVAREQDDRGTLIGSSKPCTSRSGTQYARRVGATPTMLAPSSNTDDNATPIRERQWWVRRHREAKGNAWSDARCVKRAGASASPFRRYLKHLLARAGRSIRFLLCFL